MGLPCKDRIRLHAQEVDLKVSLCYCSSDPTLDQSRQENIHTDENEEGRLSCFLLPLLANSSNGSYHFLLNLPGFC